MINYKRILSAFISLIVVMLSLSSATMAWLAMNRTVWSKNQKMTIQAVSDVATLDCYAIRYDGSLGAVCYKIGENEGEYLAVEMTEFDRIFRDRTVNTPLIYVIELANVPDNPNYYISVKVPCLEKYIKVGNTETNSYVGDGDGLKYSINQYISNIISVKVGCGGAITPLTPTLVQRVENNVNVFNAQRTYFRSVTSGDRVGQFATVVEDDVNGTYTYSKTTSVQVKLTQSEYHNSLYTIPNEVESTGNHLMLYVQFDYDDALMDAFISLINDDSDEDINFADDLGVIQVLVRTGGN